MAIGEMFAVAMKISGTQEMSNMNMRRAATINIY